jgi:hypothetical protein
MEYWIKNVKVVRIAEVAKLPELRRSEIRDQMTDDRWQMTAKTEKRLRTLSRKHEKGKTRKIISLARPTAWD